MIALKNNRVDKWNSKWNKIYLWLVFRRIQIWSLWWFSFYVIWHYTYKRWIASLLSWMYLYCIIIFLCICERHDCIINDRACVWFQALWKKKKKKKKKRNVFGVYRNGNFYRENALHAGKKSGKVTFICSPEKYSSHATEHADSSRGAHLLFPIAIRARLLNKMLLWESRQISAQRACVNGWQLAKMKKSIPDMSLSWNLLGWSSWSKELQKYLKNYDICENVKFGAISWKFDILSITA